MSKVEDFLTGKEEEEVIEAIRTAEMNTSGEIRVHMESHCAHNTFDRATNVFDLLQMNNTKLRNGVLFYVAVEDRSIVILGDQGINDIVPSDFWKKTMNTIVSQFKKGNTKQGLVDGILKIGEQLKKHFPYDKQDTNELPDGISVG